MKEGTSFSHYTINKKIGDGGFGDVFASTDIRTNQIVAIKCSRNDDSAKLPDYKQRFIREVALAKKLKHPNIVRTLDHGALPDGTLFIVMEFAYGENLEKLIQKQAPFSFQKSCRIMAQILNALQDAHENGFVHRDLKPANIIVNTAPNANNFVKLLDFGIAKAFDGSFADLTSQNLSQQVGFGTPQYMPPEQIFGKNIGPYTDLYAAGLIFLEMLTKTQPMVSETLSETIRRQIKEPVNVPPPYNKGPVVEIFRKALVKDYNLRYPNAKAMLADLQQALNDIETCKKMGYYMETLQAPNLSQIPKQNNQYDNYLPPGYNISEAKTNIIHMNELNNIAAAALQDKRVITSRHKIASQRSFLKYFFSYKINIIFSIVFLCLAIILTTILIVIFKSA